MSEQARKRRRGGRLRPYLPNRSDRLALVSLDDPKPFSAYWPLVLTQIVGGKTWSLSFVRYQTPEPTLIGLRATSEGASA